MKTKEIFEIGCQKITEILSPQGFKSTKKGQVLRKKSKNGEFVFEIYFQSSMRNWSGSVVIWPHISVSSLSLKKWQNEKYNSEEESGLIFSTKLENITPLKNKNTDWNIALANQDNIIPKLCELIEKYAVPVFEKLENLNNLLNDIADNSLVLNEHFDTKHQNLPIDFLIYYGSIDFAQKIFDNYLNEQKLHNKAKRVFEEMEKTGECAIKFVTDITMEKAYLNNLKIND